MTNNEPVPCNKVELKLTASGNSSVPNETLIDLSKAILAIKKKLDAFFGDNKYGLGFTGMGGLHLLAITEAMNSLVETHNKLTDGLLVAKPKTRKGGTHSVGGDYYAAPAEFILDIEKIEVQEMIAILGKTAAEVFLDRVFQINMKGMKRHLEEKLSRLRLEQAREESRHD